MAQARSSSDAASGSHDKSRKRVKSGTSSTSDPSQSSSHVHSNREHEHGRHKHSQSRSNHENAGPALIVSSSQPMPSKIRAKWKPLPAHARRHFVDHILNDVTRQVLESKSSASEKSKKAGVERSAREEEARRAALFRAVTEKVEEALATLKVPLSTSNLSASHVSANGTTAMPINFSRLQPGWSFINGPESVQEKVVSHMKLLLVIPYPHRHLQPE